MTKSAKKVTAKKVVSKKKTAKKKATKPSPKKAAKKTAKKVASKKVTKKTSSSESAASKVKGDYDLVIVESPSKAKTIKKYLGRGYQVVASNGHIKDLPKSKLGVDIKDDFEIDLVPITGKKDKIERIQELAKDANQIYLAPDMDREGEAIAFHLCEEINSKKKNIHRVVFNAVTKTAVQNAIANPGILNQEMYDSQRTRRVLDRLVGYKISPILWDKVQRGISAGRVQSVALRIIVEREDEVKAFVPEQWFSIHGEMSKDKNAFEIKYYGETASKKDDLTDQKIVDKIVKDVKGKNFTVVDVKKRERKQNPTPPFTTSKLQQEAANKLGFTAKKTMMVAQKLYEGIQLRDHGMQGLITYMRTDSVRTEPEALQNLVDYVGKKYGKDYLPSEPHIYKKKGSNKVQDAHEAIRPTSLTFSPDEVRGDLEPDQQKLYELIWNKFVSSQMSQAIIDQTSVTFENAGHFFKANGSIIKFAGFRTVYLEAAAEKSQRRGGEDDESANDESDVKSGILPEIEKGESIKCSKDPAAQEHWTSPPPRYNEASIVKDMEEKGIGRPSTYASIISNIQDRGYVEKIENRFMPTELGMVVCKMLVESFPKVMDISFTAKIEEQLDKIEEGEINWKKVLRSFWNDFEITLERAKEEMKNLKKQQIPTGINCTKCDNGEYLIKWGRNGQFLACTNYPDCNSTHDFKKDLAGKIHILPKEFFHDDCPTCGKHLEVKTGKYGRFVRCEEYPTCDTTLPYTLNVHCPECKVGKFAEKKSRYGKFFYGCTSYPDCNNAMWAPPIEHPCKGCGYPIMIERETKRDGKHFQCPKCKHKEDRDDEEVLGEEAV
ncbi:MAG: DNA topoisomerase I [Bdellovibrionales bacterium CG12_big_fil_rev_8_21_14_0_65_38_15]|nr:MAG: DNA topoisomerase I [Bdellovibrionales bacterium CG22_combo_CG10-13_8_21_14_all_38_13]PIQ56658.1 MAG: DNA topoisomerase I [Bdellovibrionales bacterium CG12_big_fil_rev_8_21_14_0_65_38_15]PIR31225.1 MAG: DNA topoisomerase I [Bdellovibrionales bacterium CG11_big_fil_rev_8_21_14_0_20_38_13]